MPHGPKRSLVETLSCLRTRVVPLRVLVRATHTMDYTPHHSTTACSARTKDVCDLAPRSRVDVAQQSSISRATATHSIRAVEFPYYLDSLEGIRHDPGCCMQAAEFKTRRSQGTATPVWSWRAETGRHSPPAGTLRHWRDCYIILLMLSRHSCSSAS